MDFIYLQTFCEVAKRGTFTRTAEALGYAQSSVTTQIQKLEEQYGAVLFERYGRTMRLTQAGEVLLPYARQMLALQSEAKTQISEQQTGTLRIGTIETLAAFYLPPVLEAFREAYPAITIALQSGNEASILQAVAAGDCDLGLILDQVSDQGQLVCVPLRHEALAIVARPDSACGQQAEIAPSDLAGARFVLTEAGCTYRALLLGALKQAAVPHQVVCELGSLEAIKQWVLHGLGIGFLPRIAVEQEVAQGALAAIPFAYASELHTQAVYLGGKWRSQAFQHVLSLLIQAGSPARER